MDTLMSVVADCLPSPAVASSDDAGRDLISFLPDDIDRISSLPDELRKNIVGRLPIRDAVRTSAVSPLWRDIWVSAPLNLDDSDLLRIREDDRVRVISRLLRNHQGPLCSVRLQFSFFEYHKDDLLLWARILASKSVEDLVFLNQPMPVDLDLPSEILRCASLSRLYIGFFRFPNTSGLQRHSGVFPCLKELGLCHTIVETRDFDYMMHCSPGLETLAIVASYSHPDRVCVRSHSQLRCVLLWLSMTDEVIMENVICLQRLLLWKTSTVSGVFPMTVKIAHTPKLRVLGYLDTGVHKLQIGNTTIEVGTQASSSTMVPSVQVLALRVFFGDKKQSKLLPAFLRCFPNIVTLHIESTNAGRPTGKISLTSWLNNSGPLECVERHVKRIFLHGFQGDRAEIAFLKFIAEIAEELKEMVIVVSSKVLDRLDMIEEKLKDIGCAYWASKDARLKASKSKSVFSFQMVSDLGLDDPFDCIFASKNP
uniref:F-box domain-containing protein n=1 Tax=Arundo donax TaxID=35708 RepID=A0A0A9DQG4_ARUDO